MEFIVGQIQFGKRQQTADNTAGVVKLNLNGCILAKPGAEQYAKKQKRNVRILE